MTAVNESYWNIDHANYKCGCRYQLTVPGLVSKLTVYGSNNDAPYDDCYIKGLIYADAAGPAPGALAATGDAVFFASNAGADWYDLTLPAPVNLSAGYYWLTWIGDSAATGFAVRGDTTGGTRRYNADTYSDGPTDPFGAGTDSAHKQCIYATYTTGIGKLAWWFNACQWSSPWEPRPSGLLIPKLAFPTI